MPERPDDNQIRREYEARRPEVAAFVELIERLVKQLCAGEQIPFQSISGRPKDTDSLVEKWARHGDYKSLADIKDMCGIRVITYYQSDVERVRDLMKRELHVFEEQSHGAESAETFGYASMHLIAQLDSRRQGLAEYLSYKDLVVEIQIRTVLQHAWAAISHKLDYKSQAEVPDRSRRKLFRVAALLETGDDLFESYRRDAEALKIDYIRLAKRDGWQGLELNLDTLQLAWSKFPLKRIRESAIEVGFRRAVTPLPADTKRRSLGRAIEAAAVYDIQTLGELLEVAKEIVKDAPELRQFAVLAAKKGYRPFAIEADVIVMKLVLTNPLGLNGLSDDLFYPPLMEALRELTSAARPGKPAEGGRRPPAGRP
jgi:ppGpp synthetase/RelA/SpoT-type nucleotidyltranferase